MASFPVYQPVGSPNLPDPRTMVVDWSGAVDKAINGFIEARKLGMQERYYNHLISQGEQREKRERDEFNWKMEQDKIKNADDADRLAMDKSNAEVERSMNTARRIDAETNTLLTKAAVEEKGRIAASDQEFARLTQNPKYAEWRNLTNSYGSTFDPIKADDMADRIRQGEAEFNPILDRLAVGSPNVKANRPGNFNDAMDKLNNLQIYDTGIPLEKTTLTQTEPDLGDIASAKDAGVDLAGIDPSRKTLKTESTGGTLKLSRNELMSRVAAGDKIGLATLAKYASSPSDVEAFMKKKAQHIIYAKDGTQESIQLGNAGIAAKDSRYVGTWADKPPQSAYTLANEIDEHIKNGTLDTAMEGKPQPLLVNGREVNNSDGSTKMILVREKVGDHYMTYREGLTKRLNERRSGMNPSGIKMVEDRLVAYDAKKIQAVEAARVQDEDIAEKQAMAEGRMKAKYGEPLETGMREILRQQRAEEKEAQRSRFYSERTRADAVASSISEGLKRRNEERQEELTRKIEGNKQINTFVAPGPTTGYELFYPEMPPKEESIWDAAKRSIRERNARREAEFRSKVNN